MNLSPYEIALIAGGFTIIGVLLGAWIGYRNSLKLHSIVEFNKAAAQFRNVFLGAILYLRDDIRIKGTGTSNKINEFLRTLIFKHMKALARFEPFLDTSQRKRMRHAWNEYCHPKGIPQDPNEKRGFRFNDYIGIEESEGADKAKEIALQKIYKILEIANFQGGHPIIAM